MSRPSDDDPEAKTVLDKVRPTVVRRRVYEPTSVPKTLVHVGASDDDDAGPPSSVNVARALASLRGDELKRLEEIVSADDDPASIRGPRSMRGSSSAMKAAEPVSNPEPVISQTVEKHVVRLGPSIALGDLALALGVSKQDLITALVTHGFFSLTVKSVLTRETARLAASVFGIATEDDDTIAESTTKKKPALHDKPKAMPKPPTAKKPPPPPKRSVNRGR